MLDRELLIEADAGGVCLAEFGDAQAPTSAIDHSMSSSRSGWLASRMRVK